jgi:putative ABC transport system permease protein
MIAPRWRKVLRDAQHARGRLVMMVAALAAGIAGVVTMLSTYIVLTRDVPANYRGTRPAAAELQLEEPLPTNAIGALAALPNVEAIEPAARVRAKLETAPGVWASVLLFVRDDVGAATVGTVALQPGGRYPRTGEVVIERSAVELSGHAVGDRIVLERDGVGRDTLLVSGVVHDPAVAPAWQEQTVYGYVSFATMQAMGAPPAMTRLSLRVREGGRDADAIERTARAVSTAAKGFGAPVHEIRIPPPEQHPHQAQMNAVMEMLLMFSLLALVLAAMLTSTIVSALLAQQVRAIAIMKSIGARTVQIRTGYLAFVAALGTMALLIGWPLGIIAGRGLTQVIAQLLNLELGAQALPLWLPLGTAVVAILLPVLVALPPIQAAARRSVRSALDDTGVAEGDSRTQQLLQAARRLPITIAWLNLGLRNVVRRRRRALYTATLMGCAGAMFLASLDLRAAWLRSVEESAASRRYQLEIGVPGGTSVARVRTVLGALPAIAVIEPWRADHAAAIDSGGILVTRVYPDGAHGGFQARVAPVATSLIAHSLSSGRWLAEGDSDAVVLNGLAQRLAYPEALVGDTIAMTVGDTPLRLRVVGISRELITAGTAYLAPRTYVRVAPDTATSNAFRIALREADRTDAAEREIRSALQRAGIVVTGVVSESRLVGGQGAHVYILVVALAVVAAIMSLVGLLGLSSSLGVSVLERTREIGVMRAVGATHGAIVRMVLAEGVVIAAVSWAIAVVAGAPLSGIVGRVLARISAQELDVRVTATAAGLWLMIVVCGALLVSLLPARRATRIQVRDALSFT